ncbi:small kinetochore-associated protein isoform X2 [Lampris incognitus]|uniref:small kinetochore-associated protein isoform X2 n=1 Tax=Lampris incognitus TaxID=2546036 RepID=UPI0024B519A9|nr:small kinetochore-associated protein isoform X2 [Lampris incognitus]
MKRTATTLKSKDTATVSSAATGLPRPVAVLRPQKENVPRKNTVAKVHKGPSTRYGQQTDLRDQNQHLVLANEELQKNLTETQERVAELEQQASDLEREKADVQKRLKECHIVLVAGQMDPREKIGEAAQQNDDQRREVLSISRDLLNELRQFDDIASKQHVQLEAIQSTMKDLIGAREHLEQERENFSLEVAEMERSLEEAERLLSN